MDERFFRVIDSEEKAYFLGLLISDGNVFKEESGSGRQASISITLDLNDEYMLLRFKNAVKSNTSIGHDGRGCGQIAVRSNLMAEDLAQYGVVPRKSFHTYLPVVTEEFMPHLIRGIFDGDGSIQAKTNPKTNKFLHAISFCGTHQLMSDIATYSAKHLTLQQEPSVYDYQNRSLSEIKYQNIHDMFVFGEWLYCDATIYLERKKKIYDDFKHWYNLEHDNTEVSG